MKIHLPIAYGYFDDPEQQDEPEFDPGLEVNCPICGLPLSPIVVTISLMPSTEDVCFNGRSYFYRADKGCYDGLSPEAQAEVDGALIDQICLSQ